MVCVDSDFWSLLTQQLSLLALRQKLTRMGQAREEVTATRLLKLKYLAGLRKRNLEMVARKESQEQTLESPEGSPMDGTRHLWMWV